MTVDELANEIGYKAIMFRINKSISETGILKEPNSKALIKFRSEGIWRCKFDKVNKAEYLIAFFNDKIQGIYEISKIFRYEDNKELWKEYYEFDRKWNWMNCRTKLIKMNPFASCENSFENWIKLSNVKERIILATKNTDNLQKYIGKKINYSCRSPFRYLNIK